MFKSAELLFNHVVRGLKMKVPRLMPQLTKTVPLATQSVPASHSPTQLVSELYAKLLKVAKAIE